MDTVVIKIKGMTCMGCVKSVTNVLQPISGVASVNVSLEQGSATISYDAAQANVSQFKSAIEDAGYEVAG